MPDISIQISCPDWRKAIPDCANIAEQAADMACRHEKTDAANGELSLLLADDDTVRELNKTYRQKDRSTNVLSFPAGGFQAMDAPQLLGDVVLAFETVAAEAARQDKPLTDHMQHLIVHGVLHLFGFDHEVEQAAEEMESTEVEILAMLGVPDPYRSELSAMEANHG